jgi:hypothetical protein
MGLYEDRVKRLHDHVMAAQKKAEKSAEPTNKELMAMLDEKGIGYDKRASKAELMELLEATQNKNTGEDLDDDEGAE